MRTACGGRVGVALWLGGAGLPGCDGGGSLPQDRLGAEYAAVTCQQGVHLLRRRRARGGCPLTKRHAGRGSARRPASTVAAGTRRQRTPGASSITAIAPAAVSTHCRRCPARSGAADEELRRFPDCLHIYEGTVAPGGSLRAQRRVRRRLLRRGSAGRASASRSAEWANRARPAAACRSLRARPTPRAFRPCARIRCRTARPAATTPTARAPSAKRVSAACR